MRGYQRDEELDINNYELGLGEVIVGQTYHQDLKPALHITPVPEGVTKPAVGQLVDSEEVLPHMQGTLIGEVSGQEVKFCYPPRGTLSLNFHSEKGLTNLIEDLIALRAIAYDSVENLSEDSKDTAQLIARAKFRAEGLSAMPDWQAYRRQQELD